MEGSLFLFIIFLHIDGMIEIINYARLIPQEGGTEKEDLKTRNFKTVSVDL